VSLTYFAYVAYLHDLYTHICILSRFDHLLCVPLPLNIHTPVAPLIFLPAASFALCLMSAVFMPLKRSLFFGHFLVYVADVKSSTQLIFVAFDLFYVVYDILCHFISLTLRA
jgi:hypothetical protein